MSGTMMVIAMENQDFLPAIVQLPPHSGQVPSSLRDHGPYSLQELLQRAQ
jgi:hypothetical protein